MADTAPKPLTEAEEKTLQELTDRKAEIAYQDAERVRKEKLAASAPVVELLKLIDVDKLRAAMTLARESDIDPIMRESIGRLEQVILFDANRLREQLETLKVPIPRITPLASQTAE